MHFQCVRAPIFFTFDEKKVEHALISSHFISSMDEIPCVLIRCPPSSSKTNLVYLLPPHHPLPYITDPEKKVYSLYKARAAARSPKRPAPETAISTRLAAPVWVELEAELEPVALEEPLADEAALAPLPEPEPDEPEPEPAVAVAPELPPVVVAPAPAAPVALAGKKWEVKQACSQEA